MTVYYKVLSPNREAIHGGTGRWPEPGVWTERVDNVRPCKRGYHIVTITQLTAWIPSGPCSVWEVEHGDVLITDTNKAVTDTARLTRETVFADVRDDYNRIVAAAQADYDRIKAAARKDYTRIEAAARKDYNRIVAAALADYYRIEAAARKDYTRIEAAALADYYRIEAAAWADYDRLVDAAWADYDRIMDAALRAAVTARTPATARRRLTKIEAMMKEEG